MECPSCNYQDGYEWIDDKYVEVEGEHGDFYRLPIRLEREDNGSYYRSTESVAVFGCPNPECRNVFHSGD